MTKNFTAAEFACKCGLEDCEKRGIMPWFVEHLQALRDRVGKPLIITSGYRCAKHPAERNKKKTLPARHQQGIAADLYCPDMPLAELYAVIDSMPQFTGVGVNPYAGFIHVDCRPALQAATWQYNETGATVPWGGEWAALEGSTHAV